MGCGSSNTDRIKPSITQGNRLKNNRLVYSKITLDELRNMMKIIQDDITNHYEIKRILGQGRFGSVKMAVKKYSDLQQKFAIKTIPKERIKNNIEILRNELVVLQMVDHPNIIKSYEVYEDLKSFHIVMEYSSGGELHSRLLRKKFFKEPQAADIMYKLFYSISHMHSLGICHRDLKPENCLYDSAKDNADIKLIDFGLSKKFNPGNEMESFVGSSPYLAPEVFKKRYGPECDLWSLGIIMYTLLVGYNPFQGKDTADLYKKIMKASYCFNGDEWKRVSKEAKDLIKLLLNSDPKKRPTAAQAMDHQWFFNVRPSSGADSDYEIIQKLISFRYQNVLKVDALRVIYKFLSSKELQKEIECFRRIDSARIGFISETELNEALLRTGLNTDDVSASSNIYSGIMSECDINLDQNIDYSEFIICTLDIRTVNPKILESAFKHYTKGEGKVITKGHILKALQLSGHELDEPAIDKILSEVGEAGVIDFEHFTIMLSRT